MLGGESEESWQYSKEYDAICKSFEGYCIFYLRVCYCTAEGNLVLKIVPERVSWDRHEDGYKGEEDPEDGRVNEHDGATRVQSPS